MKTNHTADHLISITSADVSREGERVLHGISWRLRLGENWAVVGPNGSGKSTLLRLIRGDLWPEPKKNTRREYCFDGECRETVLGIKKYIGLVTPELQDRYVRRGIDIAGEEVIFTGFFDSVWLQERPGPSMVKSARHIISLLDLEGLRKRSILRMSRGEARKVLIARALVSSPKVLLMDEVFSGLDAGARKQVFGLLERTTQGRTQIILATHRMADLGPFITHAVLLKEGRIFRRGRKDRVLTPDNLRAVLDLRKAGRVSGEEVTVPAGAGCKASVNERFLIKMRDVNVYIGERNVLRNVDWEMKAGENWAVLGENGAGKSTFLRLISGDRRPASGGEINWFGVRGRRSVWDLRKKIGYISPELQAEYDEDMTGEEVVRSGFFSSIGLYRRATSRQRRLSGELMSFLGLEKLGPKPIARISYGEFRKVLIARALVKGPALLLLDEPFSGLDAASKKEFAQFLWKISQDSVSVILVAHHRDEIISSISHVLVLDRGQIVAQGRKEDILKDEVLSAHGLRYPG